MAIPITTDGTPTNGANPYVDSLVWGGAWGTDVPGTQVTVSYSFMDGVDPGGINGGELGRVWSAAAKTAYQSVLSLWSSVANIHFVQAANPNAADMWEWLLPVSYFDSDTTLGSHEVPDGLDEPGYGRFNVDNDSWTTGGLAQGGYAYVTLLHELGHGLGLAHPHDGGDRNDATLFPGVSNDEDMGTFELNQGIWTTMSYVDGWASKFPGEFDNDFGWQATPMAFDIAAIQAIYGANGTYNSGGDTYLLRDVNAAGTFWSCIWDTAGSDTISAQGLGVEFNINLNDAPLTGENAGGFVSSGDGIRGGFTIANGVVIEAAIGGRMNDSIIGNEADNTLTGGGGNDTIDGGTGNDKAVFSGVKANYTVVDLGGGTYRVTDNVGGEGVDQLTNIEILQFSDGVFGANSPPVAVNDIVTIDDTKLWTISGILNNDSDPNGDAISLSSLLSVSPNAAASVVGDKINVEYKGPDLTGDDTATISIVYQIADANGATASATLTVTVEDGDDSTSLNLVRGNGRNNVLAGTGQADLMLGLKGTDRISAGAGDDVLVGGIGNDRLSGQAGADTFRFDAIADSPWVDGKFDTINDFNRAEGDKIDLSGIDANRVLADQQRFTFVGKSSTYSDIGELDYWIEDGHTYIYGYVDADRKPEFFISVRGEVELVEEDFIL